MHQNHMGHFSTERIPMPFEYENTFLHAGVTSHTNGAAIKCGKKQVGGGLKMREQL